MYIFPFAFAKNSVFEYFDSNDQHLSINPVVILPNSNTFSDWRRACHVLWVKTH